MLPPPLGRHVCAATLAILCLSGVNGKTYEKFQGLGFGIYTGPAPVFLGVNETCDQASNKTYPWDPPFIECLILNDECGCNVETLTCEGGIGIISKVRTDWQNQQCYMGFQNTTKDVMARVAVMEAAVNRAYELSEKDETTLKIFHAPEFFWRGPNGAYPASSIFDTDDEFNALNEIGKALTMIVEQKKYEDWLFVFGTIVAAEEITDAVKNVTNTSLYLNFAPIYKGYDPVTTSSSGMRFLEPKRYISGADFLTKNRFSADSVVRDPLDEDTEKYYDNESWNSVRKWLQESANYTLIDNNWFFMDRIAFSTEICKDHEEAQAKNSFVMLSASRDKVQVPSGGDGMLYEVDAPEDMAQISLVTAAGMTINTPSFVLTDGGSVFLQDGLDEPQSPQVTTCSVSRLEDGFLLYKNCSYGNLEPFVSYDVYDSRNQTVSALSGIFSVAKGHSPQIHVFQPIPIPSVESEGSTPVPTKSPTDGSPAASVSLCQSFWFSTGVIVALACTLFI